MAGLRADGTPLAFDSVGFLAMGLLVPSDELAARWAEFDAGTIGDDAFTDEVPHLLGFTASGDPEDLGALTPTMTVPAAREEVMVAYAGAAPAGQDYMLVKNATLLNSATIIALDMGDNPLAVVLDRPKGNDDWDWAGYERFTVIRGDAAPTPTPNLVGEPVSITINADVPIGGTDSAVTCPAEVGLAFTSTGGAPGTMQGGAGLWANCTDAEFMAIDATGTFDGQTFKFSNGNPEYDYTGTLDGGIVTISGGPRNVTLVFPMP